MKNLKSIILFFCSVVVISSFSLVTLADGDMEGWQIDPAIMYMIWNESGSPTVTTSRLLGDLTVGYKFSSPLFIGATYDYDNESTAGSTTTTQTLTNYGPTIGLETSNFYLTFSYYLSTSDAQTNQTTATGSSGFQVNLGYMLPLTSSCSIGPQLSYRTLNFSSPSGATSPITTFLPYIAFSFHL